jgi:hypothetical protein
VCIIRLVALGTGWATGRFPAVRLWRFLPRTGGRQKRAGRPVPNPASPKSSAMQDVRYAPAWSQPLLLAPSRRGGRERRGSREREEDGAGDVDGEERRRREGDGGALANQLGAACSSRRRPGKGPPARLLILATAARSSAARAPWRGDEPARGGAVEMSRRAVERWSLYLALDPRRRPCSWTESKAAARRREARRRWEEEPPAAVARPAADRRERERGVPPPPLLRRRRWERV